MSRRVAMGVGAALLLGGTALFTSGAGAEISDARKSELHNLLLQDCGSCHGMTLKGGLGPALLPERIGKLPPEFLQATILQGRPGTPMPPWRGILSEEEAGWLAEQLIKGVSR